MNFRLRTDQFQCLKTIMVAIYESIADNDRALFDDLREAQRFVWLSIADELGASYSTISLPDASDLWTFSANPKRYTMMAEMPICNPSSHVVFNSK